MIISIRRALPAVLVLLTAAAAAQAPGLSPDDAKELAAYRLTMETVKKVEVATRAVIEGLRQDPQFQRLRTLESELAALEQQAGLSEAEAARLEALEREREGLKDVTVLNLDSGHSLAGMEAAIARSPLLSNALARADLSPREYAKFMMAMIQASISAGFKKAGMLKELPAGVSPENVAFVEAHQAELRAMQAEFERLMKGGG